MQQKLIILFITFSLFGCEKDAPKDVSEILFGKIGKFENGLFKDEYNNAFFPWGFNYTNAESVNLIDDNWTDPNIWQIISEDFDEMKDLKANLVRIHLQYNRFMVDASTPNEEALNILLELVELSETKRLHLDITGLASYRKSDNPAWYKEMNDRERWKTQKIFWQSVAKKVGHSKAVFAFNLMNEPVVGVDCSQTNDCEWLPGDGFGGFHFVQNISRDPSKIAAITTKDWISEMTDAIRSEDKQTLITVGFLGLGSLKRYENDLDFVSVHIYPKSGKISESVAYLQKNIVSPLVIEETANLNCTIDDLEDFLNQIDGQYHGLLGHYHGKKMEDLKRNNIKDALQLNFLKMFLRRNPN